MAVAGRQIPSGESAVQLARLEPKTQEKAEVVSPCVVSVPLLALC